MTDLMHHDAGTGSILDSRYRLDEKIGEGGMAQVYRAEDLSLQRTVAIKLMRGPTEGSRERDRVISETTLLASLSHPSLVTLFDAHISTTEPSYLVMEYIEGKTLRDRLDSGPLGSDEVAALAVDLAEALHVVHEKGVVHRDIKPSNVLLWPSPLPDREFRAKLTDFGIAYLLDATRVTAPGTVIGTAAYLAPEQLRGEPPSTAADVYGLGLVLLESLTGQRAFAHAVGHEAIVARLAVSPTVPDDLPGTWHALLTAMTASNPARRPTALQIALAATELRERHPSTGEVLAAIMDPAITPSETPVAAASQPGAAIAGAAIPPRPAPPLPEATHADVTHADTTHADATPIPEATPAGAPPDPTQASDTETRTHVFPVEDVPEAPAAGKRRTTILLIAAAILLAIVAAVAIGIAAANQAEPEQAPPLPAIEEPLGTHLDELYEEVTP
ncbi:serine/threonine-protein kinase [Microbacterium sp. NPDC019599]|uniref:serine/threonine-protein kinase n=1 Tax=Microbacterium sp. NPDC019599 TaxID=3154690 RepID=UPI0033EB29A1